MRRYTLQRRTAEYKNYKINLHFSYRRHNLPVKQVNYSAGIPCIMLAMRHHWHNAFAIPGKRTESAKMTFSSLFVQRDFEHTTLILCPKTSNDEHRRLQEILPFTPLHRRKDAFREILSREAFLPRLLCTMEDVLLFRHRSVRPMHHQMPPKSNRGFGNKLSICDAAL